MQQQNASRFATQTPISSWRASSRSAVVPALARPASNFHAPGSEEPWTQYDGLGPVTGGRDLNRNWRTTAPGSGIATGNSNGRLAQNGVQNSVFMPQGPKAGGQPRGQGPKRSSRGGPQKASGIRDRSPPRGARGAVEKQRERSPAKFGSLKSGGSRELIDEDYLKRNFKPLDKEEYKKAPKSLFTNAKAFLWDFKGISTKSLYSSPTHSVSRCIVVVTLPNKQRVEAVGDASNKVRPLLDFYTYCISMLMIVLV